MTIFFIPLSHSFHMLILIDLHFQILVLWIELLKTCLSFNFYVFPSSIDNFTDVLHFHILLLMSCWTVAPVDIIYLRECVSSTCAIFLIPG
jgi:hypothetical protein